MSDTREIPAIKRATLRVLYCYDGGDDVKLEEAARHFEATRHGQSRPQFQPHQVQKAFFGFRPRPLRLQRSTGEFQVGRFRTNRLAEITVWAGARVSVEYRFELPDGTTFNEVTEICTKLEADPVLELDARAQVRLLVEGELRSAFESPRVSDACEDYVVLAVDEFVTPLTVMELTTTYSVQLANFLRQQGKDVRLSEQFVNDTLQHRFSWSDDVTIIDWNAAFLYGDGLQDILELLEFIQVQLLGLRFLNSSLDAKLDEAYALHTSALNEIQAHAKSRFRWARSLRKLPIETAKQLGMIESGKESVEFALNQIGLLAVEARKASGAIRDAINLIGDPTLYKIHELAAERFGFARITESIEAQLRELDGIYQKVHDQKHESRGVFLELIVIALILIEVVNGFLH